MGQIRYEGSVSVSVMKRLLMEVLYVAIMWKLSVGSLCNPLLDFHSVCTSKVFDGGQRLE